MTMRYSLPNLYNSFRYSIIIILLFYFSSGTFAATRTWTGGGSNNNWTTPANWGGTAPSAGDDLVFTGNTRTTNTNDYPASTSFASITFLSGAGTFTLNGTNAITLTNFINNQKTSGTITINFDIIFASTAATVTVSNGGTLALKGSLTGTGGLTKSGNGTLSLSNPTANQWSGPTIVTAGTMIGGTQNGGDIYQTSSITVNSGATFNQPTANADNNNLQNTMILDVDGTFNMNGSQDLIGYISGGGTISNVGQAGQMGFWFSMPGTGSGSDFSGVMSGSGYIKFSGVGTTQILSGLNTYTGQTIIQSGTVSINTIQNYGATTGSSLGKPANIANGTIQLGSTADAILKYTGSGSTTNRPLDITSTTGAAIIDQSGTGTLTFTGAMASSSVTGAKTLTLEGSTTGTGVISGLITNGAGTIALSKQGSGTWTLSHANTYSGSTTISSGTLALGLNNAIPVTSTVVMDGGTLDATTFGDLMGSLDFNTPGSRIKLGTGSHTLSFTASAAQLWTGDFLFIDDWTGNFNCTSGTGPKLVIGTGNNTAVDLTAAQLAKIVFYNSSDMNYYSACQLSTGEVVASGIISALPIELLLFTSKNEGKTIELLWETASESNSQYFEVLRSADGKNFESIGKVNAAGNSSKIISYSLIDANPIAGLNYYRLLEYDVDGKHQQSQTLAVNYQNIETQVLQLYPNPSHGETALQFYSKQEDSYCLTIFNTIGKAVYSSKFESNVGECITPLNLSGLTSGNYFIMISNSYNEFPIIKFVKEE